MHSYPQISRKTLLKKLKKLGFEVIRINGSHHRMKHPDGRITTVPVHANTDLPKGLIRKIIVEDLELSIEEFFEIIN